MRVDESPERNAGFEADLEGGGGTYYNPQQTVSSEGSGGPVSVAEGGGGVGRLSLGAMTRDSNKSVDFDTQSSPQMSPATRKTVLMVHEANHRSNPRTRAVLVLRHAYRTLI